MLFAGLRRRWLLGRARAASKRGDLLEAKALSQKVLEAEGSSPAAALVLAKALLALGQRDEALAVLAGALAVDEANALAHNLVGMAFRERGDSARAESHLRRAVALQPALADAHINLGAVLNEQGRAAEAEHSLRRAVALEPKNAIAWCNLGLVLAEQGSPEEAERSFQSALRAEPRYFYARLTMVMNKLREVYTDETELRRSRVEYERALADLAAHVPTDARGVTQAADAVGWVTPFFLAYQGMNDRQLQKIYGTLICDLMARRYPELANAMPAGARVPAQRVRVGIASGFFHDHSVWKMLTRGWIQNLDRSRFEIFGYYTGQSADAETAAARDACAHFVEGVPFEALAQRIRSDRLDVLIYPDIGMEPTTVKLAALRLAPVQCTSWGHPTTSGMRTIDYFLSSEAMEPAEADTHYTERLVRLPRLSVHYTPRAYSAHALERKALGLRPGAAVYFCAQSLFKYSPRHDALFPRIARQLEDSQFVFVASQRAPALTQRFHERVKRAFERESLDPARHLVVLPRMDMSVFQALARQCDVFLDSVDWSGCNSTLECMVTGLVPVTCAGTTMRSRHTYAFLKLIQLDELIAPDFEQYADLAARLGRDRCWRDGLRHRMMERLPQLFDDMSCIRGLEDFLQTASASGHMQEPSARA